MPNLSRLEAKALWLLAEHGGRYPPAVITRDVKLREAGERAIEKVWCEYVGLTRPRRENAFRGFLAGMLAGGALLGLILL